MLAALFLTGPLGAWTPQDLRPYTAWLATPGGQLRFGLELALEPGSVRAFLVNGAERIEVPRVELTDGELLLDMPHYDSRIRARLSEPDGLALTGSWEKRRSASQVARLPFHARAVPTTPERASTSGESLQAPLGQLSGRWLVRFDDSEDPAVALLEEQDARLTGTFLTSTGDYRYLAGDVRLVPMPAGCADATKVEFSLSCFDGAHAFLFTGTLATDEEASILGDFWSGDWHHEQWRAKRDSAAELADPFAQTRWNGRTKLADLAFPDLDGKEHSLADFAGRATLLVVLGSWCPNCNDEAALLKDFDARYRERGLRILGLAFELTGEFARDAQQVRIFQQRHGLALPFFLCGTADKAEATKALGLVDRVRAFPTTIFVGEGGLPKAIHSGFAGPATGEEHQKLRRDFEARIEALLGPPR